METIVAALISAVASVIVAWIGRSAPPSPTDRPMDLPTTASPWQDKARKAWIIMLAVLLPWIVLSPIFVHHDFPGINLFVIAIVTILAAAVWPIRSLPAAAIVLALHPVNFFMEPLAKLVRHLPYPMGRVENSKVFFLLSLFSVNALIVATICYWRRKSASTISLATSPAIVDHGAPIPTPAYRAPSSASLANELKELASLHAQGKLTDEEFKKAKDHLLNE